MRKIYVHPLPIRIWHWLNAFGFITLILTGVQIRYLDLVDVLSFKTAVAVHNAVGWILVGTGITHEEMPGVFAESLGNMPLVWSPKDETPKESAE